jgi:starch synthase
VKVLFAASEAVPFCKTGGLADVAGALPPALEAKGHEVRLVLPKYRAVDAKAHGLKPLGINLRIPLGDAVENVSLWEGRLGKIPVYFVDAPKYFDRDGLYVDAKNQEYPDNDDRFILFSRAVLETAKAVDFRPDVVHAHDWQTGLIPAYLETLYLLDAFFLPTASVFTIHNIAYQGVFPKNALFQAGFTWADFTPERLEYYDQVNFLKAGLVFGHALNTVSPTYAKEVLADARFGRGMEGVLRTRPDGLAGIVNGLDRKVWDPAKDAFLRRGFSVKSMEGRAACKADLQTSLGLPADPSAPLLGMVSRLDPQKGIDDVLAVLGAGALGKDGQAVFLGSGDPDHQAALVALTKKFPGRVAYVSEFSEHLAHKIYGGADIFLMPSRFEPCGLGQMIALRYGCVPVVTPTGGLKDTVVPFDGTKGTGVGFVSQDASANAYGSALAEALALYRAGGPAWKGLQERGMALDYGWPKSVAAYTALYQRAQERKKSLPR